MIEQTWIRFRRCGAGMAALLIVAMAAGAAGCAGYKLEGKVVRGDISYAAIVDAKDPRFEESGGVPGVMISLETDPDRLSREYVGDAVTDADGNFSISVRRPGAGILMYDVGLEARRKGYEGVRQTFRLPPNSKKVLITLRAGADTLPEKEESLMEQYERFK